MWGEIAGAVIGAGANLLGADSAADANKDAVEAMQKAVGKGIRESEPFYDMGRTTLGGLNLFGNETQNILHGIMAQNPNTLTPAQRQALKDMNRNGINRLAGSGLRGAGRAGQAILGDAINRTQANFFDQNQRRSDQALGTLDTNRTRSITGQANLDAQRGNAILSARSQTAIPTANLISNSGSTWGNAITSTGSLIGESVGSLISGNNNPLNSIFSQSSDPYSGDYGTYRKGGMVRRPPPPPGFRQRGPVRTAV